MFFTHEAVDAFWGVWEEIGKPHKHGVYESTWAAFRAALGAEATGHIITDAQIDGAWRWALFHSEQYVREAIIEALRRIGIVRCEECGGSGVVADPTDDRVANKCPTCNGHGWVKK